jgi:UDP-hydrolysing UDP-N-acetyl-D-glucosamine 2-epimerase
MGLGTIGFAQAYARSRPDLLLVLGDRFEMHAAVVTALPFKLPVAHIHGGELTEGAIDDALRHSITKMSHLHFVATEPYAQRVIQMGEEPWRVVVSGAPSLDNLRHVPLLSREALADRYDVDLDDPFFLVTYHPVTLEYEQTRSQIDALLAALEEIGATVIFTYPNADTGSRLIIERVRDFIADHQRAYFLVNLGTQGYFSMMNHATAMIGNSSSGIIEAASFQLPVVNIGIRQRGRVRGENVIDVGYSKEEILAGIEQATAPSFQRAISNLVNPYGDGQAAERIVEKLRQVELGQSLLLKSFHQV